MIGLRILIIVLFVIIVMLGVSLVLTLFLKPRDFVYGEWASVHDYEDYYAEFENQRGFMFSVCLVLLLVMFLVLRYEVHHDWGKVKQIG